MTGLNIVVDHPLVDHKLGILRTGATTGRVYREIVEEIGYFLAVEATRKFTTIERSVVGLRGRQLKVQSSSDPPPLLVPILRAGLGLVSPFVSLLPSAELGALDLRRNDATLAPEAWAERVPANLEGQHCFVLDQVVATGGTLGLACALLAHRNPMSVTAVCLIATEQGIRAAREFLPGLDVVTAAIDARVGRDG